jgi:hypothetical protein
MTRSVELVLAALGATLFAIALTRKFFVDLRSGVISTQMGEVHQETAPKRFAVLRALNYALLPIAFAMVAGLWWLAIRVLAK